MALRVLISAGEVSGDQHLARVVRALKLRDPEICIRGMAGRACQEAGAVLDVDCYRSGAAMGFVELARSARGILSSFRAMSALLKAWRPDVLVLVDYPDFNLRLARIARRIGVRVLYYIPPKVWAWRTSRIKTISQCVDRIAAIFPFEPGFYERHGYSQTVFVGHPLAEQIGKATEQVVSENTVLFLPGSRRFEVERLLVPMLRAFGRIQERRPDLSPVVLLAPNVDPEWVRGLVIGKVPQSVLDRVQWRNGDPILEMRRARVGVLKSGTCNLEAAIAGLPFVCVYAGTWIAKVIASLMIPIKEYSLVNITRPHTVRELMEPTLSEVKVEREVERIIDDGTEREAVVTGLREVRDKLFLATSERDDCDDSGTVSERVAAMILDLASQGV